MTQQAAPAKCKPNLLPGVASRVDLLWTHLEQKFGLEGNHSFVQYQQRLYAICIAPETDPI
jgi:hypothetical protein